MGAEELGFCLATVAALAIPPSLSLAVDRMARSALNQKVGTGEGNERAFPLFVTEGSLSLKDDLRRVNESQAKKGIDIHEYRS